MGVVHAKLDFLNFSVRNIRQIEGKCPLLTTNCEIRFLIFSPFLTFMENVHKFLSKSKSCAGLIFDVSVSLDQY